jgi:hypothetical protein
LIYTDFNSSFVVVGDNNTILVSDDNGSTWTDDSVFSVAEPVYNVVGDPFLSGYGPEELVPGIVSDSLTMIVSTRPGTTWNVTQYGHTGYNVRTLELTATSGTQDTFSFADALMVPAQLSVSIIDGTGLGTTIYESLGAFTVDWINQTITLDSSYIPFADTLRIDIYEIGNGDQLVKSNTFTDPIRLNETTGFNEIVTNAYYAALAFEGGGVVRPGTEPSITEATETYSTTNTIRVTDISLFTLNQQIEFSGSVFGGVAIETPYYVKSISTVTSTITISDTITMTGIAGSTFVLSSDTGVMTVIVQTGTGSVYTDPIIYHNGTKLLLGTTGAVTSTKSSNNAVVVVTTSGLAADQQIVFGDDMIGTVSSHTIYYVKNVIDSNEFTISNTIGGAEVTLTDDFAPLGGILFVSADYAIALAQDRVSAKIIFAEEYVDTTDYLVYSLFTETYPVQYGYTIPETEMFVGDGATATFSLSNYSSDENEENAIVEVDGLRILPSDYTINGSLETIVFNTAPTGNIAVTTYNDTNRQYLNTWSGVAASTTTVSNIISVNNTLTPYLASTFVTDTSSTTITCTSTAGFVVDQTIQFKSPTGTPFGNLAVDGTVYWVLNILSGTTFEISTTQGGSAFDAGTASGGNLPTYVGGQETTRVTTGIPHELTTNDIIRIDGVSGSTQLNDQTFYVHVISDTIIDLYEYFPEQPSLDYDPNNGAVNYPITDVSTYTGGGYVWLNGTFYLYDTTAIDVVTLSGDNVIEVSDASMLVDNTPVYFTETYVPIGSPTSIPEIIAGDRYYLKSINYGTNTFSVTDTYDGNAIALTVVTPALPINVKQWLQTNVDRLYVTVNGLRVPSSQLRIGAGNQISILTVIETGDEIVITSMIPTSTPDEQIYLQFVDKENNGSVYQAGSATRTWTVENLYELQDDIFVDDISRITNTVVETKTTPVSTDGYRQIALNANKNDLLNVTVYNNNPARLGFISEQNYQIVVESLVPQLRIADGSYISTGDVLTITSIEGKFVLINGEIMTIYAVDVDTNMISVYRGSNGTGISAFVPKYTEVYGLLSDNRMSDINYNDTWNKIPGIYNTADGDPLQIAEGQAANFLRSDNT